ncbi:MAG: tRNA (guanosine(46)-N7)-methyltransferase TrmB [Gammaproteobacteria bacterium]|nr:tRNA (guanosine(46)-N7)-methyltransferase TrmB [Gammaproteobacteria bacterium]
MQKQTIQSFVLRKGRMSPRQQQGLTQWLLDYQLPLSDQSWQDQACFQNQAERIVDIGFGMGQALVTLAQTAPLSQFIGIEVHPPGIGSLAADLHDHQIQNVYIAPYDAYKVFTDLIPAASLTGIQLFFPDPWPKKRHHKRRLVQPAFIDLMVRALQPNGFIHIATDWEDYANHCLALLNHHPHLHNQATDGLYVPRPVSRPLTKFELRGQKLGHLVFDMIFNKLP